MLDTSVQVYGVSVERIYAVESSAFPSYEEIKNLPNKILLWCGKFKPFFFLLSVIHGIMAADHACMHDPMARTTRHEHEHVCNPRYSLITPVLDFSRRH